MPTNDERREVAAKLRELAQESARCGDDGVSERACRVLLGPRVDLLDVVDAHFPLAHLADLIEPEERTCHDVSFDSREFVCSWCGCHIDVLGIESEPTMWLGGSPIEPSFCPNCGARVVQQ